MSSFLVVSNRLPVSVSRNKDGTFSFNHTSGGLGTAMSSLKLKSGYLWIGWPGIASDDLTAEDKKLISGVLLKNYGCVPVFQTKQQIAEFYEGYANDTLWPLFHYFPCNAEYHQNYWQAYRKVNQLYLQAILQHASPDSTIWIHDYHLLLLPQQTREALPSAKIGFFLHIPFPSYELFRQLPERNEIVEGLLGANLVGFHIYDYARHFISSTIRLLGAESSGGDVQYNGRTTRVDTFPIGIDYQRFTQQLEAKESKKELKQLEKNHAGHKLIVAVDRLDYSKGILERLRGFELFLAEHPEYHSKVVLQMIESPSRTEVPAYKLLRDEVEQMVSRINGQFSTYHWTPIIYLFQNFGFDKIVPLYHRADVALITSMRDGMNLVAKEYIASKADRSGVLILSEMAGAADELIDAIQINPNDTQQVANSIHQALTMPEDEQRARLKRMQKRVSEYSVQRWGNEFTKELARAANAQSGALKKRVSMRQLGDEIAEYVNASSRLLLLDYDGTLSPFSATPSKNAARPSEQLLGYLEGLSKQASTKVAIISGRTKDVMEQWFGHLPKLCLVAEHGAWIKDHGEWENRVPEFEKKPFLKVLNQFALKTAGAVVDEKDASLVWHYRRVNPELAYVRNQELRHELRQLTAGSDIGVFDGPKNLEIKPVNLNKGIIAREIADRYPSDYILAAGDDETDEELFDVLPSHATAYKIGSGNTIAKYQLPTSANLLEVLARYSQQVINYD